MKKVQLLAVIASPTGSPRKFVNCDVTAVICDNGVLKCEFAHFSQHGGYGCLSGYQECLINEGYMHEPFWHRKAKLEKGCEWINLKKCRRDLIKSAIKHLSYQYDEIEVADDCLVRFDHVCLIDPWREVVTLKFEREESWLSQYELTDRLIGAHWQWNLVEDPWVYWRGRIAALPVLPFRYRSHYGKNRWLKMAGVLDKTPETIKLVASVLDLRARHVKRTWKDVQKTVKRAIQKGKTSTAAAREWFAKNQMLSRFLGWAEKQHNQ